MRRFVLSVLAFALPLPLIAQAPDSILARGFVFRGIGPALMGGRISEIAVAEKGRVGSVIYIAAATGGVWRSTNAGVSWTSLFDSVRAPSIGAVAVAPSNPDVVWVGTGEPQNMRSSSWGNGVYKSTDGGRTWSAPMLPKSQHIGRIVIDPRDPKVVYVAAVGPLWAPGGERGATKNRGICLGPALRSPGGLGRLAARRLLSHQQRRGKVAKKDEAEPAGCSGPAVGNGLNWLPGTPEHGGKVPGGRRLVK